MMRIKRVLVALAVAATFVGVPMGAVHAGDAGDSGHEEMANKAFDAVVLRPLDAGALLSGGVLMVPATAFGLVGGTEPVEDAWDLLVLTSWESLVDRPLGHWGS